MNAHLDELQVFRRGYLMLTLFVSGAAVLVVEIIGARMVAAYYGSSIYVWSSLITVTLVSLALGYWLGGKYADQRPGVVSMYDAVLASAVSLGSVPLLRIPVLTLFAPLGVRAGSLFAVTALFLPPLFLLGTVTPCAVGIASARTTAVAALTGRLYAVSTIGSVAGALASGFILVPLLPGEGIICALAAVLAVAALVPYAAGGRYGRAGAALTALLFCLFLLLKHAALPRTEAASVIFRQDSPYADIRVVESSSGRSLLVNGVVQGSINHRGFPADRYFYTVDALVRSYRPGTQDTLVIGLGTGAYPRLQRAGGGRTDVVEIDPVVSLAAMRYFGYQSSNGTFFLQDGRDHLRSTEKRYDCIFIDVYAAESLPIHLFTVESFRLTARALNDNGILAVNFHDSRDGTKNRASRSIVRTLRAVFHDVRSFEVQPWHDRSIANTVFLASQQPLMQKEAFAPVRRSNGAAVPAPRPLDIDGAGGVLLTDAYNPLDSIYDPISEAMRTATLRAFPPGLLL